MVMMGLEFTGRHAVPDVYVHSVIQAPDGRRMSKSLGHRHRPARSHRRRAAPAGLQGGRRLPGLRGRRGALRAARDVLDAGRALQRGEGRPGPAAGQQALERVALLLLQAIDERRARRRARRPSRTAGSSRGSSAPRRRLGSRIAQFDFAHAALGLYDFVYGELCDWYLELVKPRLYDEDSAAPQSRRRSCTCCARRSRWPTRSIPFVTEEIWASRRRARACSPARDCRAPAARARRRGRRGADRARDRRHPGLRGWRDGRRRAARSLAAGAVLGRGLRGDRRAGRAARAAAHRRQWCDAGGHGGRARRHGRGAPQRRASTSARPRRGWPSSASASRPRSRARRQALKRGVRVQGAAPRWWRPSARSSSGCTRSSQSCEPLDARRGAEALPARPRALRHALRAGPHAPAADRAGLAAGALRLRPRRRHERQVLDGADGRGDPRARTGCERAPTSPRTWCRSPSACASATPTSTPATFAAAVRHVARAVEKVERTLPAGERVTQFEAMTAAAFHELARRAVDVAVIEAGLGGRYDATNVIPSRVQVLTNVGLEHTRWLGPSLVDIAAEKLAVVRPGATLVVGRPAPGCRSAGARRGRVGRGAAGARARELGGDACGGRRLPAPQLRARTRSRPGLPRSARRGRGGARGRDAHRPGAPAGSGPGPAHARRRCTQPGWDRGAGRLAAGDRGRPATGRRRVDPRGQGRRGDAAPAAARLLRDRVHQHREPARAAARDAASRSPVSLRARRPSWSPSRAPRSRVHAFLRAPPASRWRPARSTSSPISSPRRAARRASRM